VLGMIVRGGMVLMPDEKRDAIQNAISAIISVGATTKRKIYSLLGKVNFFHNLGSDLATTTTLIYDWTKKLNNWDNSQQIPDNVISPQLPREEAYDVHALT